MSNTLEKVIHILVEKIGIAPTEATTDANFIKDLGIDSLDYAEIVMEFEQTFDIRIPDSDAKGFKLSDRPLNILMRKF